MEKQNPQQQFDQAVRDIFDRIIAEASQHMEGRADTLEEVHGMVMKDHHGVEPLSERETLIARAACQWTLAYLMSDEYFGTLLSSQIPGVSIVAEDSGEPVDNPAPTPDELSRLWRPGDPE